MHVRSDNNISYNSKTAVKLNLGKSCSFSGHIVEKVEIDIIFKVMTNIYIIFYFR